MTISNLDALYLALLLGIVGYAGIVSTRNARAHARRQHLSDLAGDYVAEAWLEWEICRGSTLYRGRFDSPERAQTAAQAHARALDDVLPRVYRSEDAAGNACLEYYEYEIRWGVRKLTDSERIEGVRTFWFPVMPGSRGHAGEHASAHPLRRASQAELDELAGKGRAQLQGYRY